MSAPVLFRSRIALLRIRQRVRSMDGMRNTSQVRDRDISRSLPFADNRSHYYLPVRLYRPVVYTPPGSRHVRQTVSKQNRRNSGHIPVGTGDIPCPIGLVTSLSDQIEAAFAPGRLDPSIRHTTWQNYRCLSPDWS